MRAVPKNFNKVPSGLLTNNLHEVIDTSRPKHRDKINDSIYRHPTVLAKLFSIYNYKCAYCESFEAEPEVEHYRPKKGVTGEKHIGYYWLCYEWSNLLPACHDCNKTRSKGNHFPIEGHRAIKETLKNGTIDLDENKLTSKSLYQTEIPLLLNPEFPNFNPFNYFTFNSFGEMCPVGNRSELEFRQAHTTIDKMRLNRDRLFLLVRKRAIKYYMARVKMILYKYINDKDIKRYEEDFIILIREIYEKKKPTKFNEYTFFWEYFYINFKVYISYYFKGRLREGLYLTYDYAKITVES